MDSKSTKMPAAAFANMLRVGIKPGEIYLTFAQVAQPPSEGAHLVSSLVTSPVCAKSILRVLTESVERYEEQFGEITEPVQANAPAKVAKARPARAKRKAAG
jgi:hypothetical protein